MITVSCTTAPSVPRVVCNAIYMCSNGTEAAVVLDTSLTLTTRQQCNITIKVVFADNLVETLDQETYTNIIPLVQQPTAPATTATTQSTMLPTGKHDRVYCTSNTWMYCRLFSGFLQINRILFPCNCAQYCYCAEFLLHNNVLLEYNLLNG